MRSINRMVSSDQVPLRRRKSQHCLATVLDKHCSAPDNFAWQSRGSFKCNTCMRCLAEGKNVFMLNDHSYCSQVCVNLARQRALALRDLERRRKKQREVVREVKEFTSVGHKPLAMRKELPETIHEFKETFLRLVFMINVFVTKPMMSAAQVHASTYCKTISDCDFTHLVVA